MLTQIKAKGQGYDDVVYLDAVQNCFLEEVSSCNIFVVQGNVIKTPPLQGTILPGVTRRSVIQMARDEGFDVVEESISAEEAMKADEVFTTGTAVVLTTVGSLTYRGQRREYGQSGQPTPVGMRLYEKLAKLQNESVEDPYGWVEPVVGL